MKNVLLVEDEFLVRELLAAELSDMGFEVFAAGDGDEALAILRDGHPFDLLFTDVNMPGSIDGWELARQARRLHPELSIVYATGYSAKSQLSEREAVICKPFATDDIIDVLEKVGLSVPEGS